MPFENNLNLLLLKNSKTRNLQVNKLHEISYLLTTTYNKCIKGFKAAAAESIHQLDLTKRQNFYHRLSLSLCLLNPGRGIQPDKIRKQYGFSVYN